MQTSHNLIPNDHGGITYASPQRIGQPEQRSEILADVRMVTDGLTELCEKIRTDWPQHVPMPQDLRAMLCFQDFVLARIRNGSLKRFAKACAQ